MKKFLLINSNTEKFPYPVPPIGLSLLQEVLQENYEVRIFDGVFRPVEEIANEINIFKPDYIGLSIRNIDDMVIQNPKFYLKDIKETFVTAIRKNSQAPLILGGSAFSIYAEEMMEYFEADYGVEGEAGEAIKELLIALENQILFPQIPGVHHKKGNTPRLLSKKTGVLHIPFADIDQKINFEPYRDRGVYSIQTKRGCYHKCIYCTYPLIEGTAYQRRPAKEIADEIEHAYKRIGDVTFEFVDSTFNDPPQHAEEICREIIKRNCKVRLRTMGINPAHASAELFELMIKAGFSQVDSTPDSASPRMLINLKKNFSLQQLIRTAELLKSFDLPTMWFFLFGGPGENRETLLESFEFIDQWVSPKDMVHMTAGLRVYKGTPLYEVAIDEGKITRDQSLLSPPYFYVSDEIEFNVMRQMIRDFARQHHYCIPAGETTPPPQMLQEANMLRKEQGLTEPMFRTLLRMRKNWLDEGKLTLD